MMPALSQQQQKLMGLALAVKRGQIPLSKASKSIQKLAKSMTEKDIEKFITDKLIKNGRVHEYKLDIPGFKMTFNIETAIAIRRHELNKK